MAESLAERVAREVVNDVCDGTIPSRQVLIAYAQQRIQAAIDEAVLHNFTVGELVEVAVRAARERFSKECERFHNEGKQCATCGRKENFTQRELDEAVLAEREACANEARRGDGWHDPSDRIAAAIRARSVGAPTSTQVGLVCRDSAVNLREARPDVPSDRAAHK
jgi:hypothetical protein